MNRNLAATDGIELLLAQASRQVRVALNDGVAESGVDGVFAIFGRTVEAARLRRRARAGSSAGCAASGRRAAWRRKNRRQLPSDDQATQHQRNQGTKDAPDTPTLEALPRSSQTATVPRKVPPGVAPKIAHLLGFAAKRFHEAGRA